MMNSNTTDLRLLLPESIWLEPEQVEQARGISQQAEGESGQWQAYLNALAVLGLEQWFHARSPERLIQQETSKIATAGVLKVDQFNLCLLATEHVLDEVISVPQAAIDQPELVSHFYVALEVNEEQAEIIVRGFLRHDQLMDYCHRANLTALNGCYSVPLSCFDPEPNHLLFHCQYLEPASIPLPSTTTDRSVSSATIADSIRSSLQETRTKLSQWLEGAVEETWQTIDTLINPSAALALSTRNLESNIRRGKLLDLGVQLGREAVALLVIVIPEAENKLGVSVQLHPTSEAKTLPPNLKLTLLSKLGNVLQEVESRQYDSYIQLRSFRGEPGKCFSIEITLGGTRVKEDFEL
ncbi:MAG TPA: DUF1822 family protein [Allocoleopsis sp.]